MFLKPYNLTLSINLYGSCTASYYGKTYRHIMQVQVSEHQGVSPRTGKRVKGRHPRQ